MPPFPDDNPSPTRPPVCLDPTERPNWLTGDALQYVRYLTRGTVAAEVLSEAIVAVCKQAPQAMTKRELAETLGRSEGTLAAHLPKLVLAGRIRGEGRPIRYS